MGEVSCGNGSGALWIAQHSHCPSEAWHDEVAWMRKLDKEGVLRYVNVGANKGYNLLAFAQRYGRSATTPTVSHWHQLLMRNGTSFSSASASLVAGHSGSGSAPTCQSQCCGVCGTCHERSRAPGPRNGILRMYALEMLPANAALLRRVIDASDGTVPAKVFQMGVSDGSETRAGGNLFAPSNVMAGYETTSVTTSSHFGSLPVPTTTIDEFFAVQGIDRAHMLTVDTEGWDGRVLAGARKTLQAQRIDVLEFEYSVKWHVHGPHLSLRATLQWMLDSAGYRCFWQGFSRAPVRGMLAPASGDCWQAAFSRLHPQSWGNLVCSYRKDVLRVLSKRSLGPACGLPEACS